MSLFPAYSVLTTNEIEGAESKSQDIGVASKWLENNSFACHVEQLSKSVEHSLSLSEQTDEDVHIPKKRKKRSKSKRHKNKSANKNKSPPINKSDLEFCGDEKFYVDKTAATQYNTIETLCKPACPRYRVYQRKLGLKSSSVKSKSTSTKRYFRLEKHISEPKISILSENDFTLQLGQLNRKTIEAHAELQPWLNLIQLQARNPYKWPRLFLAEKQLDIIQRALAYHPRSEPLYSLYIDIISETYPSFEVSKMLDRLLSKDPYNYTLWMAQIMASQGSMARCIVPDVLKIYERCMKKMHYYDTQKVSSADDKSSSNSDEVMLKLFNNCALFLRQGGLYESFFALLKLALELNVSTNHFTDFIPLDSDQQTLIEYEELILQSGLPMNELWLRIEKLRQGFNFLPYPENSKCSDPLRIVYNEDICHYIYPLKSHENSFYMILLVLRLLKLPFVQCNGLAEKFNSNDELIGDSDAIEDILAVCIRRHFALHYQQDELLESIYELGREMAVSPTFLSNTIGNEIYRRCLSEMVLCCASANVDERQRIILTLLWCRFERLLLFLEKCAKRLDENYLKEGRSRFKSLLKKNSNRNVIHFYTEFALYEYEALQSGESVDPVKKIFENVISANADNETLSSDLAHIYVSYAEILLNNGLCEEALQVLVSYILSSEIKHKSSITSAKKLVALKKINEKVDTIIGIERNVEIMVIEQYLLPDYTISLLKIRALMQYLMGNKLEATNQLEKLLNVFRCTSDRHKFLREHIQELYIITLQLPCSNILVPSAHVSKKIFSALKEFPRNLYLLLRCGMLSTVPWYKIRSAMLNNKPSIMSVTFLIATARYRFIQLINANAAQVLNIVDEITESVTEWDKKHNEMLVRIRILNMFKTLTSTEPDGNQDIKYKTLQRNSLFWRFYLRCLSDQSTSFETSKKCLLNALDECPWSKALYLDGATYVPQELTNLQDLIIEKQLRIYALPEELEILRQQ